MVHALNKNREQHTSMLLPVLFRLNGIYLLFDYKLLVSGKLLTNISDSLRIQLLMWCFRIGGLYETATRSSLNNRVYERSEHPR